MKQKINSKSATKPDVSTKNSLDMASLLKGENTLLDIPKDCLNELKSKGLAHRWIDVVELSKNHGSHKKGWAPYKFECKLPGASNPFAVTAGQYEGYLVRRQLVLAVLPDAEAELLRARNKLRTKMQSDPVKMKRDEMRDYVKKSGLDSLVTGNEDMSDDE